MSLLGKTDAEIVELVAAQEQRLVFDAFPISLAHDIGQKLVETAKAQKAPVVIDLTRSGQCLFHCALDGATPDNAVWVLRKNRVVQRFHRSSLYMGALCRTKGCSLEEKFLLPQNAFAAHGGAFPITLRDSGVIGSVTVSGLPQIEDHDMVVSALAEFAG